MIPILASLAAVISFITAVLWAGVMDVVTMKIRNEIIVFLVASYAAFAPLAGLGAVEIGWSAAVAATVLTCMFFFFAMGWIGGGDAKLASVVALWLGTEQALSYLVCTGVFGGALTLALLQFRSVPLPALCLHMPWIMRLHARESGVPYGVAIASAALVVFPNTPWMATLI